MALKKLFTFPFSDGETGKSLFERKNRDAVGLLLALDGSVQENALMSFRVLGLDSNKFSHLYGLSDADLAAAGAKRYVVDATPGFPDCVEVRDLDVGERAILLNYEHQPADTPYRSRHAIFVREGASRALNVADTIPDVIRIRPISLRAFSGDGEMVDADLVDGDALAPLIERFFSNPAVAYLHVHYAKRGCYAARIVRT